MSIVPLFCEIHDFFIVYEAYLATHCLPRKVPSEIRGHRRRLRTSEVVMTLITFHQSNYRTLKHFYEKFEQLQHGTFKKLYGRVLWGKLHLICNDAAKLLVFLFTPAKTRNRHPGPK